MNRLEEHIRTELQNREITPSPEAWSRISEELKTDENPPARNRYWWAIAAGFAGIILIATVFFNNEFSIDKTDNPVVVEEEVQNVDPEENINPVQNDNAGTTTPQNDLVIETLPAVEQLKKEKPFNTPHEKEPLAQNNYSTDKAPLNDGVGVSERDINDKLEAVLEQVNTMEKNAIVVTDAEIDSLILAAQRELLNKEAFRESRKVDAMALLGEVELELYDAQRNPLFNTLKEGFFKLRTAVADRNN